MNSFLNDNEFKVLVRELEDRTGLLFTQERRRELQIKLFEHSSGRELIDKAKTSEEAMQQLVNRVTVGESYFFRNKPHFDALRNKIIPSLIKMPGHPKELRIWCAGCSTGEEPYSVAMMLDEFHEQLKDWSVSIVATDINTDFLEKAQRGLYKAWSFRGVEEGIIDKYFVHQKDDKYGLDKKIKKAVQFKKLNLSNLSYNEFFSNQKFDLIMCRNVLIYFSMETANDVIEQMAKAIRLGGYLVLGHSEVFQTADLLEPVYSDATYFYRRAEQKTSRHARHRITLNAAVPGIGVDSIIPINPTAQTSMLHSSRGRRQPPKKDHVLRMKLSDKATEISRTLKTAKQLANLKKASEAYDLLTELAIGKGKLDYRVHYFKALMAEQAGHQQMIVKSLKQAIFLNKKFVIGHFYLGIIHERQGDYQQALRNFRNVRTLLEQIPGEHHLEEAEGLTAQRLMEVVETRFDEMRRRSDSQ